MRTTARWLVLTLMAVGCGAANDGISPTAAPGTRPAVAIAPPPAPVSPAPACVPEAVRAAIATCPQHPVRRHPAGQRPSLPRPSPTLLSPAPTAGAPTATDPCSRQAHLARAALAGTKDEAMRELENLLAVYQAVDGARDPASKRACAAVTGPLLIEVAMAWNAEALGTDGVRGTGDAATIDLTARLYERVLQAFTRDEIASFAYPDLSREHWPTAVRLRYALADLRYFAKDWSRCGPAFDAVVDAEPDGPLADEASYAAVLCYQSLYSDAHKHGEGPRAEDDKAERNMLSAFGRYLCAGAPDPAQSDAYTRWVEIAYARARLFFETKRWDESAVAFRDVAINHADAEVGVYAAQLYLESLNMLASAKEAQHPTCYDDMAADVPRFVALYCKGDRATENEETCSILTRIQADLDRLHAGGH